MKRISLICIVLFLFLAGCDYGREIEDPGCVGPECVDITSLTKEKGLDYLNNWQKNIQSTIDQVNCVDATNLKIVPIGAKGCGGPTGFVAYPNQTYNQNVFDNIVNFSKAQEAYNKKWGIVSDCSLPQAPKRAECVNGKITLIY